MPASGRSSSSRSRRCAPSRARLLEVAAVLELPVWKRMTKIVLPAAFARINVGLRVAAAISLVVAVTIEIVLNPRGLGYHLVLAQQSLHIGLMWAQLVWLCLLGFVLNLDAQPRRRRLGIDVEAAMRRLLDPINLAALGFALSLLVAWQLLADAHLISPIFFPSPLRAIEVLQYRAFDGSLWVSLGGDRSAHGGWLAACLGHRHRPRCGHRLVPVGARAAQSNARIHPAAARFGRHSRRHPVPRPVQCDVTDRHRVRGRLAGPARERPRLLFGFAATDRRVACARLQPP